MWAGYFEGGTVESMKDSSLSAIEFLFDDGHLGYVFEFEHYFMWVSHHWVLA